MERIKSRFRTWPCLQYSMLHCRISKQPLSQPFLIQMNWYFAWWLYIPYEIFFYSLKMAINHSRVTQKISSNGWEMSEMWAVEYLEILQRCIEYCLQSAVLHGHCFHIRLVPFHIGCRLLRDATVLHGILQRHGFDSRLDHYSLDSYHEKFQLNPLRNDRSRL